MEHKRDAVSANSSNRKRKVQAITKLFSSFLNSWIPDVDIAMAAYLDAVSGFEPCDVEAAVTRFASGEIKGYGRKNIPSTADLCIECRARREFRKIKQRNEVYTAEVEHARAVGRGEGFDEWKARMRHNGREIIAMTDKKRTAGDVIRAMAKLKSGGVMQP